MLPFDISSLQPDRRSESHYKIMEDTATASKADHLVVLVHGKENKVPEISRTPDVDDRRHLHGAECQTYNLYYLQMHKGNHSRIYQG